MIRQAVILAGGKGTRLGKLTESTPKPVLPVGGQPFINYLIWNLVRHGIKDIIISSGYQHDQMVEAIKEHPIAGVTIKFVQETTPLGTGGGLRNCLPFLDAGFFVLNGDSIFDVNYLDLARLAKGYACLALRHVEDTARYGRVELDGELVDSFSEKGKSGPGFINGGIYFLTKNIVTRLGDGFSSLEQDLFPRLAKEKLLRAGSYSGFFIDIGTMQDFSRAQKALPNWKRKPALFLDRDGVLNENFGYVHTKEKWKWCSGAMDAIKYANDRRMLVILVTNQSGIGRGYYEPAVFHELMDWVQGELGAIGAHFDAVYYCPHHPEEAIGKYLRHCDCRKPEPGMFLQALEQWDIDLDASIMIGDSEKDLVAGKLAGVKSTFFFDPKSMDLLDCVKKIVAPLENEE